MPNEACGHSDDTESEGNELRCVVGFGGAGKYGDLYGSTDFCRLTESDSGGARLVGACDAGGSFSDIEARALCSACGLVAKFCIADMRIADGNEVLTSDVIGLLGVMGKRVSTCGRGHASHCADGAATASAAD